MNLQEYCKWDCCWSHCIRKLKIEEFHYALYTSDLYEKG